MTDAPLPTMGARVRHHRKSLGMKQAELARLAKVSAQAIGQIEREETRSSSHIVEIAEALGVSARYLRCLTDDPTPETTVAEVAAKVRAELSRDLPAEFWVAADNLLKRYKAP